MNPLTEERMKENKSGYITTVSALISVFLVIVIQAVGVILFMVFNDLFPDGMKENNIIVLSFLSIAIVTVFMYRIKKIPVRRLFPIHYGVIDFLPGVIFSTFGIYVFNIFLVSHLIYLFPEMGEINEAFVKALPDNILFFVLFAVILAPLSEEFFFRGLIFNGMRIRFSFMKSLIISTILFSGIHVNPSQVISTLTIGLFFGYLMDRAGSILVPILAHSLYNSYGILFSFLFENVELIRDLPGIKTDAYTYNIIDVFAIAALIAGFHLSNRNKRVAA